MFYPCKFLVCLNSKFHSLPLDGKAALFLICVSCLGRLSMFFTVFWPWWYRKTSWIAKGAGIIYKIDFPFNADACRWIYWPHSILTQLISVISHTVPSKNKCENCWICHLFDNSQVQDSVWAAYSCAKIVQTTHDMEYSDQWILSADFVQELLQKMGPAWLTKAFHAAGWLGIYWIWYYQSILDDCDNSWSKCSNVGLFWSN